MKEPSLPISLFVLSDRKKIRPQRALLYFTTLGGGGEGGVYIEPRQSGL